MLRKRKYKEFLLFLKASPDLINGVTSEEIKYLKRRIKELEETIKCKGSKENYLGDYLIDSYYYNNEEEIEKLNIILNSYNINNF